METIPTVPEVTAPWEVAAGSIAAEHVRTWWHRAQHVYPVNTLRAWRFDWSIYLRFCTEHLINPLPAEPASVAAFVAHCRAAGKKPATVQRYLATIALAHRVAKLENPVTDGAVKLELKGFHAAVSVRQKQAHPLGWTDIKRYLATW